MSASEKHADSVVPMDRRSLAKTLLLAASAALRTDAQSAPEPRLVPWMYMNYPLEQWLTDYRRTLDAWEEGGVRGVVLGPLRFWDGTPSFDFSYLRAVAAIQAFAPDASITAGTALTHRRVSALARRSGR